MTTSLPFVIRHRDGREYELAGDAAGKTAYRDQYMPQHFAIVDPQPTGYERPDLSEAKPKAKADTKPKAEPVERTDAQNVAVLTKANDAHEAHIAATGKDN